MTRDAPPPPGFTAFAAELPAFPAFLVLRYRADYLGQAEREERVYAYPPERDHYPPVVSFFATYVNDRYPQTLCDCGQYVWVNSYTTHGPAWWRPMTPGEEAAFRAATYRFDKPRPGLFARPPEKSPCPKPKPKPKPTPPRSRPSTPSTPRRRVGTRGRRGGG